MVVVPVVIEFGGAILGKQGSRTVESKDRRESSTAGLGETIQHGQAVKRCSSKKRMVLSGHFYS